MDMMQRLRRLFPEDAFGQEKAPAIAAVAPALWDPRQIEEQGRSEGIRQEESDVETEFFEAAGGVPQVFQIF